MNLTALETYVRETGRRLDALEADLAEERKALMFIETALGKMNALSRRGIASWSGKAGEYTKRTVAESATA